MLKMLSLQPCPFKGRQNEIVRVTSPRDVFIHLKHLSVSFLTDDLLKENTELKEQKLCKICMVSDVNIVFLPCGHLVACATCAPALQMCPICRAAIKGTVRTYMS